MRYCVTGCLGFIGSAFVRKVLGSDPDAEIVGIARPTNPRHLERLEGWENNTRFHLRYTDIATGDLTGIMDDVDVVIGFAAKTHVDHSIRSPAPFIESNISGTFRLLEEFRKSKTPKLFIQFSTDEVYGYILKGEYHEDARLNPTNVYSATKAAGDMLALAYRNTYSLPLIITRTENNHGPWQSREKVIPTFVRHALAGKPLPVYGTGDAQRMWIHVNDTIAALNTLIDRGKVGEIYHVAGGKTMTNLELAKLVLEHLGKPEDQVEFIPDSVARPGHDPRYALNSDKIRALGWKPVYEMDEGIRATVDWFVAHHEWYA